MGDIKKPKKKYKKPMHPWQKARIDEEKIILKEYGLKNKKEIWRLGSKLKNFKMQAKYAVAATTKQAELQKAQLLNKLMRLGLLSKEGADLDAILSLTLKDLFERRLQTRVMRLGLANSTKKSRQFITHGHITVDGKKITSPSYIVPIDKENKIGFSETSSLKDLEHPERIQKKEEKKEETKESKEEAPKEEKKEKKASKEKEKKEPKKQKKKPEEKTGESKE